MNPTSPAYTLFDIAAIADQAGSRDPSADLAKTLSLFQDRIEDFSVILKPDKELSGNVITLINSNADVKDESFNFRITIPYESHEAGGEEYVSRVMQVTGQISGVTATFLLFHSTRIPLDEIDSTNIAFALITKPDGDSKLLLSGPGRQFPINEATTEELKVITDEFTAAFLHIREMDSIKKLGLDTRLNGVLRRAGIVAVDQLTQKTDKELEDLEGLARTSRYAIERALATLGLTIRLVDSDTL